MKTYEYDTVIIGAGCVGSSIAFDLTRRGFRNILVIDSGQAQVSATASSGGMLRVFHENPEHVELALNNLDLLKTYQEENVVKENNSANGSLYFFDQRRYRDYAANLQIMESRKYPFEILTPQNGRRSFPQFQWLPNQWAVYEPSGTHLSSLSFANDLLRSSQAAGLAIRPAFEVERICHFRDRYRIFSHDSTVTAKTLILAGGARLVPQLRELGIGHSLKTNIITTYRLQKQNLEMTLPNFFDRENLEYGRLGQGSEIILSNPNTQRFIKPYWHAETAMEVSAPDCYSPQRMGYAGFLLGHPRLILATGWGGTAFKFSLEIGRRIGHALITETNERTNSHAISYF